MSQHYRESNLGNKSNALDELLFIILSLRTHERGYRESYRRFKARFPSWALAATAFEDEIRDTIKPGGLAVQKAARIKQALVLIQSEFGEVSLRKIRQMEEGDAMRFLLRLPAVCIGSEQLVPGRLGSRFHDLLRQRKERTTGEQIAQDKSQITWQAAFPSKGEANGSKPSGRVRREKGSTG